VSAAEQAAEAIRERAAAREREGNRLLKIYRPSGLCFPIAIRALLPDALADRITSPRR